MRGVKDPEVGDRQVAIMLGVWAGEARRWEKGGVQLPCLHNWARTGQRSSRGNWAGPEIDCDSLSTESRVRGTIWIGHIVGAY